MPGHGAEIMGSRKGGVMDRRTASRLASALLRWYDRNRRELPWRYPSGVRPDPYVVWLSEIMLQQTTVATVGPYFRRFLDRWPTVQALAQAPRDDLMQAWAGLGYYARARNLHRCAAEVAARGGVFPEDPVALEELPGVGPYTAAAIAAIAFDHRVAAVDGNVERVVSRLVGIDTPLPAAKPEIRAVAQSLVPRRRSGDFAQALMDLGATVCIPRAPTCAGCPWRGDCVATGTGTPGAWPRRPPRKTRPVRHAVAFVVSDASGRIMLRKRPDDGLLGGMMGVPMSDFRDDPWLAREVDAVAPLVASWRAVGGQVRHVFTHFEIAVSVYCGEAGDSPVGSSGSWRDARRLDDQALPTLMRKILRHARVSGARPARGSKGVER
jgi:A/G-specific adenine glycosylase